MASAIVLHIVGPQFFILAPIIVQALVATRGLTPAEANTVAFAEGMAKAMATLLLAAVVSKIDWRVLLRIALALLVGGNLLAAFAQSQELLLFARTITGTATGIIVPTAYATVALTSRPDPNFGVLIATLMVYGMIGFASAARLVEWGGTAALFLAMAGLAAIAWPLVRYMPSGGRAPEPAPAGPRPTGSAAVTRGGALDLRRALAVAAVFVNFTGFLAYWVNAGLVGASTGLDTAAVGTALAASQVAGILGASLVGALGAHAGRLLPLAIGIFGQAVAVWLTGRNPDLAALTVAVCLFAFCQNLTHPFLLGTLAALDRTGRVVAIGTSGQMLGVAAGPALAALLLASPAGIPQLKLVSIALLVLSFLLLVPALLATRKGDGTKLGGEAPA